MGNPAPSNLDTTGYTGALDVFDTATPFDVLHFIVRQIINSGCTMMPCLVQAVQLGSPTTSAPPTVTVQPTVNQVDGDGNATPHGSIYNIPCFRMQAGPVGIIVDPAVGEIGVVVFASHDISSVKANRAVSNPGSYRRFNWSDGVYFGSMLGEALTTYIQVGVGAITLTTPAGGTVTVNTGSATVNAQTNATVTAPQIDLVGECHIGALGGKKVALNGDPVVGGVIVASSTKAFAT